MGSCASTRHHDEEESEVCYTFNVTNLDSNKKLVKYGTLKVMSSGLKYTSEDKQELIVWVWHHVRKFACDGEVFTFEVGHSHPSGDGEYWFSCKNVAILFLRVHNFIARERNLQQHAEKGTKNEDSLRRYASTSTERQSRNSKLQSPGRSVRNGNARSASSRSTPTKSPSRAKVVMATPSSFTVQSNADFSPSSNSMPINNVEMTIASSSVSIKCETDDVASNLEQGTSFIGSSTGTSNLSLGSESKSSTTLQQPAKSNTCDEELALCSKRKPSSNSQSRRKKKIGSHGSSKSGCGSVRSMSPLLETTGNNLRLEASSSPSDMKPRQSQSSSYVNLTPYINVTTSDSPLPPPLPPKGIKPASIEENSEEDSLDGLCGVSCSSDVFLPATDVKEEKKVDDSFITRRLSSATVVCKLCVTKPRAVTYCYDCRGFVCAECSKQHLRMAMFINHNLFVKESDCAMSAGTSESTGCMFATTMKYTDIIFQEASTDQSVENGEDLVEPVDATKSRHERALSCGDKYLYQVDYSKIDHQATKELSQLKAERMLERSWNTEERRASMGNKFSSKTRHSN